MDAKTARRYLEKGLHQLQKQLPDWQRRQRYLEGDHDLPYAPDGVNTEYVALQKQSIANWMGIAAGAPVQRMRADGILRGDGNPDLDTWNAVWQPNKLDALQSIVFLQMVVHGRGIWSVSRNPKRPDRPIVRVENCRRVWIEPDPENPFESLFAVKTFTVDDGSTPTSLWVPDGVLQQVGPVQVAYVYDHSSWARFEKKGDGFSGGVWSLTKEGFHGLGELPFVPSDANLDADGNPRSVIAELMPQQDAINTIRFNTLLAMQFSAYRQRVFTGYDPVLRDEQGEPIYKRDGNDQLVLDDNGMPIPLLTPMGRIGVDRALVFPGEKTQVFDLPESNLDNYVKVYQDFLTTFFATGQIPPQYMLTRMANLSGDALTGAESTLQALIADLKDGAGEALETVIRLGNRARSGPGGDDYSGEIHWSDKEARSFAQIIDAIVKLITTGFPREDAWAMIPGATPPKVQAWLEHAAQEREQADAVMDYVNRELNAVPGSEGGPNVAAGVG